jgi:hypothetical protein
VISNNATVVNPRWNAILSARYIPGHTLMILF